MKKIFAFLVSIILIFSLSGCKTNRSTKAETQDAYCAMDAPAYSGTNIEQFVEAWKIAHALKQSDNALYTTTANSSQTATLTVPIIQTTDFTLEEMHVFYWTTNYSFIPTQSKGRIHPLSKIRIGISDKFTYEVKEYFILFEDGNIVYDPFNNVWRIHNGNVTIEVIFPEDIILSSPEQISDYFTFETYTAGGGNDHVVS